MTKKYSHLLILALCCFVLEGLKPNSAEAKRCQDLETECAQRARLPMIYGEPPYCNVWKGYSEDDRAEKACNEDYKQNKSAFAACNDAFRVAAFNAGNTQMRCD